MLRERYDNEYNCVMKQLYLLNIIAIISALVFVINIVYAVMGICSNSALEIIQQ